MKAQSAVAPAPTSGRSCSWSDGRKTCVKLPAQVASWYGVECLFSLKDEDVVSRGTLLPFFSFLVGYRPALSKSVRESRQAVKGRQAFRRKAFTSSE